MKKIESRGEAARAEAMNHTRGKRRKVPCKVQNRFDGVGGGSNWGEQRGGERKKVLKAVVPEPWGKGGRSKSPRRFWIWRDRVLTQGDESPGKSFAILGEENDHN